jgi:hypothetical protein
LRYIADFLSVKLYKTSGVLRAPPLSGRQTKRLEKLVVRGKIEEFVSLEALGMVGYSFSEYSLLIETMTSAASSLESL